MTRIGVIGLGTIGQTHMAALRQLQAAELYGADPSVSARRKVRAYTTGSFANFETMLSKAQVEGVVIATPPRTHRDIALACVDAGVAVLTEKPLALTIDDCEAIADRAARSQRPFLVGFCHRFQPEVAGLRKLIDARTLGEPVLVAIAFTHGLTEQGREWIVDPHQAGGGVLFDSGSHAIDLFRFLVGELDEGCGLTVGERPGVEDYCVLGLRSGSVLGSVALSWKTPPWHGLIDVVGTEGRSRVEYDSERVTLSTRAVHGGWRSVRVAREDRFVAQMRHFLACIRGTETPLTGARDGLEVTRAILTIYAERRTSGTRGSRSVSGHIVRTHAMSGSSDAAMVRRSPARKFR